MEDWIFYLIIAIFIMLSQYITSKKDAQAEAQQKLNEEKLNAKIRLLEGHIKFLESKKSNGPTITIHRISDDEVPDEIKDMIAGIFGGKPQMSKEQARVNHNDREKEYLLAELKKYPKAVYSKEDDVEDLKTVLSLFKEEE